MYIMCVMLCLFSILSCRVDALQISIIFNCNCEASPWHLPHHDPPPVSPLHAQGRRYLLLTDLEEFLHLPHILFIQLAAELLLLCVLP